MWQRETAWKIKNVLLIRGRSSEFGVRSSDFGAVLQPTNTGYRIHDIGFASRGAPMQEPHAKFRRRRCLVPTAYRNTYLRCLPSSQPQDSRLQNAKLSYKQSGEFGAGLRNNGQPQRTCTVVYRCAGGGGLVRFRTGHNRNIIPPLHLQIQKNTGKSWLFETAIFEGGCFLYSCTVQLFEQLYKHDRTAKQPNPVLLIQGLPFLHF